MAGVKGTKDNEAESRFGKKTTHDKKAADSSSIRPLQFMSGLSSGQLFLRKPNSYPEDLGSWFGGQHRITKTLHESNQRDSKQLMKTLQQLSLTLRGLNL